MHAAVLGLLLAAVQAATALDLKTDYQYCIVGGGPGGLQLGHYLKSAGRDYVLFERTKDAGHFFTRSATVHAAASETCARTSYCVATDRAQRPQVSDPPAAHLTQQAAHRPR